MSILEAKLRFFKSAKGRFLVEAKQSAAEGARALAYERLSRNRHRVGTAIGPTQRLEDAKALKKKILAIQ